MGKIVVSKKKLGILIILLVLITSALEAFGAINIITDKEVPQTIPSKSTTSSSTNPTTEEPSSTTDNPQEPKPQQPSSTKVAPTPTASASSNATLLKPTGSFVSNHHPGDNGSPTQIDSICISTPGATCYIQFKNTSTNQTTKLKAQTLGSDGSTSWNWDSKTLTSGQWQVTALATLGDKTESTTDPLLLEIK